MEFMTDLVSVFPNAFFHAREDFLVSDVTAFAESEGFTDIMIVDIGLKGPGSFSK